MLERAPQYQNNSSGAADLLGEIIAEFTEETAGVPLTMGRVLSGLGALLVAARLLFDVHLFFLIAGATGIVFGLLLIVAGNALKRNRVLVHANGLVQLKGGESQRCLWKDVEHILVDERRHYASGLGYSVHYYCSLQHGDGTATKLDAITIKPPILKLMQECWQTRAHLRNDT